MFSIIVGSVFIATGCANGPWELHRLARRPRQRRLSDRLRLVATRQAGHRARVSLTTITAGLLILVIGLSPNTPWRVAFLVLWAATLVWDGAIWLRSRIRRRAEA